jgi:hypothetical protein
LGGGARRTGDRQNIGQNVGQNLATHGLLRHL